MTNADTVKASGSNIRSILSATALAFTTTLAPPSPRAEERMQQAALVGPFDDEADTDPCFVLSESYGSGLSCYPPVKYGAARALMLNYNRISRSRHWPLSPHVAIYNFDNDARVDDMTESAVTIGRASAFYATLSEELKSETLWDVLVLSQNAGAPLPVVERIDDMVTADFSSPGALVSVLIEEDACFVSAFGRQKEVQGTFVLKPEAPKIELQQLLWSQFQSLRAFSEA